jgi:hypothetical protein
VNSLALKQSGINRATKNPFGGEILKDPKTGEATGILAEAATSLIKVRGTDVKSTPEQDIIRGLEHAAKLGLTSVQTSSGLLEIEIYKKLDREGKLTLRFYTWLPIEGIDN